VTRLALPLALASALAAACSGGPTIPTTSRVAVTLALHGAGATPVHGVDAQLALPAGAQVASDAATGRVAAAALRLEGAAAAGVVEGRFVPHRRAPSVRLLVASGAALGDGALVSVTLSVPGGVPAASAFELAAAVVSGASGQPLPSAGLLVTGVAAAP